MVETRQRNAGRIQQKAAAAGRTALASAQMGMEELVPSPLCLYPVWQASGPRMALMGPPGVPPQGTAGTRPRAWPGMLYGGVMSPWAGSGVPHHRLPILPCQGESRSDNHQFWGEIPRVPGHQCAQRVRPPPEPQGPCSHPFPPAAGCPGAGRGSRHRSTPRRRGAQPAPANVPSDEIRDDSARCRGARLGCRPRRDNGLH